MLFRTIVVAALLVPAVANADSDGVALALGSVIAGEQPCDLHYEQAAIQRYIADAVPSSDMGFANTLGIIVRASTSEIRQMGESEKTAFCAQTRRVAQHYGFIDGAN